MKYNNYFTYFFISLLITILVLLFVFNCTRKEGFTAPGLTLTNPPSWFPQNAANPYNKKDWESKMYLDRYPFRYNTDEYLSQKKSDDLASVYRFWKN